MKKATKAKVNKALTPEEKAILGNIRSLLEQLDSEEISEDMNAPAVDEADVELATEQEDVGEEIIDEEEEVEKACDEEKVKKSSAPDEVANNTADKRMTAEDTDVENALAVLKSFLSRKEQKVQKSADYARLEKKVDKLAYAVEGMLEGFGMERPRAPVQKSSRDLMTQLASMVAKSKNEQPAQSEGDLSDVMVSLFSK